jgi:hypothetical protein
MFKVNFGKLVKKGYVIIKEIDPTQKGGNFMEAKLEIIQYGDKCDKSP